VNDASVADLRATVDKAIEEIGRAQGALGLTRDRIQSARDVLRIGLRGSSRDESTAAQAALTEVDTKVEEAIQASLIAVEQLVVWTGSL
jgi:hypothetical protein